MPSDLLSGVAAQRSCLCGPAHGSMPCGPASSRLLRPSGTDARFYHLRPAGRGSVTYITIGVGLGGVKIPLSRVHHHHSWAAHAGSQPRHPRARSRNVMQLLRGPVLESKPFQQLGGAMQELEHPRLRPINCINLAQTLTLTPNGDGQQPVPAHRSSCCSFPKDFCPPLP